MSGKQVKVWQMRDRMKRQNERKKALMTKHHLGKKRKKNQTEPKLKKPTQSLDNNLKWLRIMSSRSSTIKKALSKVATSWASLCPIHAGPSTFTSPGVTETQRMREGWGFICWNSEDWLQCQKVTLGRYNQGRTQPTAEPKSLLLLCNMLYECTGKALSQGAGNASVYWTNTG